jgi:hypothetical protein
MNVKHLVGKHVVIQFRGGDTWVTSHVDQDQVAVIVMMDPNTKQH